MGKLFRAHLNPNKSIISNPDCVKLHIEPIRGAIMLSILNENFCDPQIKLNPVFSPGIIVQRSIKIPIRDKNKNL